VADQLSSTTASQSVLKGVESIWHLTAVGAAERVRFWVAGARRRVSAQEGHRSMEGRVPDQEERIVTLKLSLHRCFPLLTFGDAFPRRRSCLLLKLELLSLTLPCPPSPSTLATILFHRPSSQCKIACGTAKPRSSTLC
jgi:hypothetical protein